MKQLELTKSWKIINRVSIISMAIIILVINLYTNKLIEMCIILILLLSLYIVILTRSNTYLFLCSFFISYSNYSILMTHYITPVYKSYFLVLRNDNCNITGINILLFFMISLLCFLPLNINSSKFKQNFIKFKNNNIICILLCIILCMILIFAFGRPDIEGERGSPNALYEYSIILFIVSFYYSGNKKRNTYILTILLIAFTLQNFVFGGRITGIQLLLCYFVIFFAYKYNYKNILPYIFIGVFLMSLIGIIRADWSSFKGITYIFEHLKNLNFSLDTAMSSYFTSLTFLKYKDISSTKEIMLQFYKFILSIFLGGSMVTGSNLASITHDYILHYFGGVLPFYFYYWFGYFGVFLIGFVVSAYYRLINKIRNNKDYFKLLGVYIIVTVPRWYLYSPNSLFRGALLFTLVFYCTNVVDSLIQKKNISIGG